MFGPQVSIIFVPTFNCNCNCTYCFEPRSHESISLEDVVNRFQPSYLHILPVPGSGRLMCTGRAAK